MANAIYFDDNRFAEFVESETADEIIAIGYINMKPEDWVVRFEWKNKGPDDYVIPAWTPYSTIGIPPGQRKWLPPLDGSGTGPFDSDVGEVSG